MNVYRTKQINIEPAKEQFHSFTSLYDYFNKELFNGELPGCILNFSREAINVIGFFSYQRWFKGKTLTHEISLNPARLGSMDAQHIAATLVHEMTHLWQYELGTPSRPGYHNKEWANKMETIGLMPSNTSQVGGKRIGQQMSHYPIEDGLFLKVFKKMPQEYILPWLCVDAYKYKLLIDELNGLKTDLKKLHEPLASMGEDKGEGIGISGKKAEPAKIPDVINKLIEAKNPFVIKKYEKNKIKYTCECGYNVWGKPGLEITCKQCGHDFKDES